jgi:uncharacterized protein (DUF362 family)
VATHRKEEGSKVEPKKYTRREFLQTSAGMMVGVAASSLLTNAPSAFLAQKPTVSVVKIENGNIGTAVEKAIDLLGGIETVTEGKERIMLKPNLVAEGSTFTTKPEVIRTLAQMMQNVGKEVLIGEGSAGANGFNIIGGVQYRTKNPEILENMQKFIFDRLGYTQLAESMGIPLINLHCGDMVDVEVPGGFVYDKITLHRSLVDIDLLCSVPMMKTHSMAQVTLGIKNLVGVFPGQIYQSARSLVHREGAKVEPSGTAAVIIDMVRANKLGLVVVDGSMAMEGQGPASGTLVKMDLIIAGTNPLATDVVAASIMGFDPKEVPTFTWAEKAGMSPANLDGIEVRGEQIGDVRRRFVRAAISPWANLDGWWAAQELNGKEEKAVAPTGKCPILWGQIR